MSEDFPKQATDAVIKVVDAVRDKTTGPAVNAAHALKYGIVLVILVFVLAVLGLIMLMRVSEAVVRSLAEGLGAKSSLWLEPIWLVYLIFGLVFAMAGLWFWHKANRPARA